MNTRDLCIYGICLIIVGAASLASPGLAFSAFINVECFKYEIDYWDSEYGDFFTTSEDREARGVWAEVKTKPGGTIVWQGYTDPEDEHDGCIASLSLNTTGNYQIKLYAKAEIDDGTRVIVKSGPNGYIHSQVVSSSFTPTSGVYYYEFFYTLHPTVKASDVLAAASYALDWHSGGVDAYEYYYFTQDCPSGNFPSCSTSQGIYLSEGHRYSKFVIAHETGHKMADAGNDDLGSISDYSYSSTYPCGSSSDGHSYKSQEWQTAATWEGFANFYAASSWNDPYESDCAYIGDDCESNEKYMETFCAVPFGDRGVESDWTHFWWDLYAFDAALQVWEIIEIYDIASPHNWSNSNVYSRLRTAATFGGYTTTTLWDSTALYEGIDH